MLIVNIVPWD